MNEIEAIELVVDRLGRVVCAPDVVLGTGDDAAVVRFSGEKDTVVTTDVLLEGRHFPVGSRGDLVGYRSIAVNLSDLAAMGACPKFLTVALTIEEADQEWLCSFADGVRTCCLEYEAVVVGGNFTRGPKSIAVTALGSVEMGQTLRRSGARLNDDVWLTGSIGAPVLALTDLRNEINESLSHLLEKRSHSAVAKYFLPQPRVQFAMQLHGLASAATDVSDGLVSELDQLVRQNGFGVEVDVDALPLWPNADLDETISADDSYELLFSAAPEHQSEIQTIAESTDTPVARIGSIASTEGIRFCREGTVLKVGSGYSHF